MTISGSDPEPDLALGQGALDFRPVAATAALPEQAVSERVSARIAASVPNATRRAYTTDWNTYTAWCARVGRTALPATAATLAEYASALADMGKASSTIRRAISAIRVIHKLNDLPLPDTTAARAVVKAYRLERADAGLPNERRAKALSLAELRSVAETLDGASPTEVRDRLLFVLGWSMMARRSELAALNLMDVTEVEEGLEIFVRRSKTDRAVRGRTAAVPFGADPLTCPVRLMRAWRTLLAERGITVGPLFRRIDQSGHIGGQPGMDVNMVGSSDGRLTGDGIWYIIKRVARRAGLDDAAIKAHSLRAGGATAAYTGGADLLAIGRHGGWKDGSAVLLRYIRDVDRWKKNPMYGAGL